MANSQSERPWTSCLQGPAFIFLVKLSDKNDFKKGKRKEGKRKNDKRKKIDKRKEERL